MQTMPNIAVIMSTGKCDNSDMFSSCIDTLLEQTYKNFTIYVLIDEQNRTLYRTVLSYLVKDKRIKLVTTSSQTQVADLYYGSEIVSENLIAFVDVSEWFDANYLLNLYEQMVSTGAQIVVSAFTLYEEATGTYRFFNPEIVSDKRDAKFIVEKTPAFMWYEQFRQLSLTGKLYHQSVLKKAKLLGEMTHDTLVAVKHNLLCNHIAFTPSTQYVRRNSQFLAVSEQNILQYLLEFHQILNYLAYKNYDAQHYLTYYHMQLNDLLRMCRDVGNQQLIEKLEQERNAISVLMTL